MQPADMLHELARAGSIEALLERRDELTRNDLFTRQLNPMTGGAICRMVK